MLENTREHSQIFHDSTIRRVGKRLGLQSRTGATSAPCWKIYTRDQSKILHDGTIRLRGSRLGLQARTGLGTFCTNCGFSFFNSPSPYLHVHVQLVLVQRLHHSGKCSQIFANLPRRHYTAR